MFAELKQNKNNIEMTKKFQSALNWNTLCRILQWTNKAQGKVKKITKKVQKWHRNGLIGPATIAFARLYVAAAVITIWITTTQATKWPHLLEWDLKRRQWWSHCNDLKVSDCLYDSFAFQPTIRLHTNYCGLLMISVRMIYAHNEWKLYTFYQKQNFDPFFGDLIVLAASRISYAWNTSERCN